MSDLAKRKITLGKPKAPAAQAQTAKPQTAKAQTAKPQTAGLVLGGEPRVQLMPPEVGLRAKARGTRRLMVTILIGAVLLVGIGYGFAVVTSALAASALTQAQQETQALVAEQQKYAEASSAAAVVSQVEQARTIGASTEVVWSDLVSAVRANLPAGSVIESATMTGRAPWEPELKQAGPLRAPRVATVAFVITSPSILDATAIVRGLSVVPGFGDATLDTVAFTNGSYSTTVTLNVDKTALSGRFATKDTK